MVLFLFAGYFAHSQRIEGRVFAFGGSKERIPFATISLRGTTQGVISDIDGKFSLRLPSGYLGDIVVSHASYEPKYFAVQDFIQSPNIYLVKRTTALENVVFEAEENPADRIIRGVIKNRKKHDPSKLDAYKATSYTKEIWKLESRDEMADSLVHVALNNYGIKLTKQDSSVLRLDTLVKKNHLFLSETVAEMKYISPNVVNEKVLATNVTGSKGDMFAATGSSYQTFGFYTDVFSVAFLDKEFVNPINPSGLSRYDFYIEDTTFFEQDTVFVISFEPKKNDRFEALKGFLYIHAKNLAITNVIAESVDPLAKIDFKVRQVYDRIGNYWFPVQLNTTIGLKEFDVHGRKVIIENNRYLSDIEINPPFTLKDFSDVAFSIDRIEEEVQQKIMTRTRHQELDSLERNTFSFVEDKNLNLESVEKMMEILFTLRIPVGKVDIKIEDIIDFNRYEKIRLGFGMETNDSFSKKLRFGGYGAYGFNDEAWKYGGDVKWAFDRRTNTNLLFKYKNDIKEIGRFRFFEENVLSFSDILRKWQGGLFDNKIGYSASFYTNITPFVKAQVAYSSHKESPNYVYQYENGTEVFSEYQINEISASIKYSKKERYINLYGRKVLVGYEFPVLQFRYSQGNAEWFDGDIDFRRYDLSFEYRKNYRFGKSYINLVGGYIDGEVPYGRLLTGIGNGPSNWSVPNYFQTMGLYEFASDKMVALYFNHNFGNVLIANKYMKPEFLIFQNTGIGDLSSPERHTGVNLETMEKGYFESGVGFRNILRFNYLNVAYMGLGLEGFYRYGAYTFAETSDNIFVKFNLNFSF